MKTFFYRLLLFTTIIVASLHLIAFYLLWKDKYKSIVAASEVYHVISKSNSKNKSKKVVIGDSVGRQLFNNRKHNDTINSFACNQAISMAGHYFLVNNYLYSGNKIDSLFLLFNPLAFKNNLDQYYTYNYFIKPFYLQEYFPLYTNTVYHQVGQIPYYEFSQYPLLLTSNWSPDFEKEEDQSFTFLSPVSVDYLKKIKELAAKNNFKLILLPTPVSLQKKKEVEKLNKKEIVDNDFQNEFKDYFDNIVYVEDKHFVDGIHLYHPEKYTAYYKNEFMR